MLFAVALFVENVATFTDRYAAITRHFECEQCVLLRSGESRDPCRWITMSRLPAIIRGLFVTIRKKNSRARRFKRQCRLSETVTTIPFLL